LLVKKEFKEMWRIVEGNQNLCSMMRSQLDMARANITAAVHSQQSLQLLVEQTGGTYDMSAHVLDKEKKSKRPRYNFER
jgi:acetolactate synthase regulatory subunit